MTSDMVVLPRDGEESPEPEIKEVGKAKWVFYAGEPIVELGRKKSIDNMWVHPEPGYQFGRCKMLTRRGGRCKQAVRMGNVVCRHHGAGTAAKPGGRPPVTGKHSKHLPLRLLEQYEEFMNNPDVLSMRSELALLDMRVGEILERLDTSHSDAAWGKIRLAYSILKRMDGIDDASMLDMEGLLEEAIDIEVEEREVWDEVGKLIEQRRKVADTERRRVVDAHQYLSYSEATAMLAFVVDTVMTHVDDPQVRKLIAERLRVFAHTTGGKN